VVGGKRSRGPLDDDGCGEQPFDDRKRELLLLARVLVEHRNEAIERIDESRAAFGGGAAAPGFECRIDFRFSLLDALVLAHHQAHDGGDLRRAALQQLRPQLLVFGRVIAASFRRSIMCARYISRVSMDGPWVVVGVSVVAIQVIPPEACKF
jgi:hypothetical protein